MNITFVEFLKSTENFNTQSLLINLQFKLLRKLLIDLNNTYLTVPTCQMIVKNLILVILEIFLYILDFKNYQHIFFKI